MKKIKQAVILAGGIGKRMQPLTFTTPKPMIKIQGRPFLDNIIKLLKKNNIEEIVILVGYLHQQIIDYYKDGSDWGLKIKYSINPAEMETGTRIKMAKSLIDNIFLLVYADNYWPLKLDELLSFYNKQKTLGLITIYSNIDNYTKNNIKVNEKGIVEIYDKPRMTKGLNGVDIGFYIFKKSVIDYIPIRNNNFEKSVLPKLIKKKQLSGYLTNHKYYSLSNLQRIPAIENYFKKKKVIFLDRDGVINKKAPKAQYITHYKDFIFLPKVKKALRLLKNKGYMIFIITNQSGIARGFMSNEALDYIHKYMLNELNKIDVSIDDIFICKHGWDEGCFCRKPRPGMFFQAASKYQLDLYSCFSIGDDKRDKMAATSVGIKTFLVSDKENLYDIVRHYL
jgi:histidinol-phosphate phosphatase family protein